LSTRACGHTPTRKGIGIANGPRCPPSTSARRGTLSCPAKLRTLASPEMSGQRLRAACLGFLLALSPLVGCTKACTAVGASSGVTFNVSQITAGLTGRIQVRACVERSCVTRLQSAARWSLLSVAPGIEGPGSRSVHLTIRDVSGETVFDATTEVQLQTFQPNGPHCDPTVYVAAVSATTDGQLIQQSTS
jgi:hypothetical protein